MNIQHDPSNPLENEYEEFFDGGMTEIERLHALQSKARSGVDLLNEIGPGTPFGQYIRLRKKLAANALVNLYSADAKDAVQITQYQQIVREYLILVDYVNETLTAAGMARDMIVEEYGPDEAESETYGGTTDG
ncbi:MAG: hypothetical protein KDB32_12360 [Planctomycetes bacterium]|nr:hypothetical protein [Planctomycetota bacterium]